MKTQRTKKLQLSKTSIRTLSDASLAVANGGADSRFILYTLVSWTSTYYTNGETCATYCGC